MTEDLYKRIPAIHITITGIKKDTNSGTMYVARVRASLSGAIGASNRCCELSAATTPDPHSDDGAK